MILTLKELIVLKEKLKNTYAYQNGKKLKEKNPYKRTDDDLVYELVEFMEEYIERKTKDNSRLNDKVSIGFLESIEKIEEIAKIDIPKI